MRLTVHLEQADIEEAIREHLKRRGFAKVEDITLSQNGLPDSSDPREQGVWIGATAKCTPQAPRE